MPILRIENPRAMLTAANIRLESGCEDKYLSLQRPPPNPYLLVGTVEKMITFYQSQEDEYLLLQGAALLQIHIVEIEEGK